MAIQWLEIPEKYILHFLQQQYEKASFKELAVRETGYFKPKNPFCSHIVIL